MSDNKQIPTIQNTLDMMPISHFFDEKTGRMVCFADDVKAILEYRDKEVVKYTLQQAAERGKLIECPRSCMHIDECDESCKVIDKQSILSLEVEIIEKLKL